MTAVDDIVAELQALVGKRHVLSAARRTLRYRRGFRSAPGEALAVVQPGTLVQMWRVLRAVTRRDIAIIMQAANTGLTGGSNPDAAIGRPVVIVCTLRLRGTHVSKDGSQVVCMPGETLHQLERVLRPLGREPHSIIGSSCLGASVVGGICNNSGGALVRRGPAFTEMAVYARMDESGDLKLVNEIGADLDGEPEELLSRLELGKFDLLPKAKLTSDATYHQHVRDVDAATPARYNADPRRLHGASGSAGHVAVFAVRLDTFERSLGDVTFYLGTNDVREFTALRRALLDAARPLPISAEYLHREAFRIADRYGRDMFWAVRVLGTDRLPWLFAAKARLDALGNSLGLSDFPERIFQRIGAILPDQLPRRLRVWHDRFEHHLILKVDKGAQRSTKELIGKLFPSATGDAFECTQDEATKAALHRFVTAGAVIRCAAVSRRTISGIVALDVALPRNAVEWFGPVPDELECSVARVARYGHFLCHVFHRDYLIARGSNSSEVKARLLCELDCLGAEYPAEHNVGRQYSAKSALRRFYQQLDPCNSFNPGVGLTPTAAHWGECQRELGE